DLLVSAAARPEFYSPSPSLLTRPSESLIATLLPGAQAVRSALRALQTRSMYRLASKDYAAAWADSRACWRLGEHAGRGWTLVHRLIGIACRGAALRNTQAILNEADLPPEVARQILSDFQALKPRIDMAEAIDFGERLMFIDSVLRLRGGGDHDLAAMVGDPGLVSQLDRLRLDANVILRQGNAWYDRLVASASIEDRTERVAELRSFDQEVEQIGQFSGSRIVGGLLSGSRRNELVGDVLLSLFLPAVNAANDAADRDQAYLTLAQTAAALAIYRLEHGEYPEALGQLAPEILPQPPVDLYTGAPLVYQKRGEGYLLYSAFTDGKDDGGDDLSGDIVDGEWTDADDAQPARGDADLVIRMPLPRRDRPSLVEDDSP
ncbi:MAG: hypothetical protein AAF961_05115, partial [Planctomycetota bacterium]